MPVTRTVEWRDPFASANDHPIRIHVSNNKAAFPELYKVASAGVDGVIRFPPSGAIAAELLALAHLSSISPYLSATDQKTAALWLFQAQAYGAEGHLMNLNHNSLTVESFSTTLKEQLPEALRTALLQALEEQLPEALRTALPQALGDPQTRRLLQLDALENLTVTRQVEAARIINKELNSRNKAVFGIMIPGRARPQSEPPTSRDDVAQLAEADVDLWAQHYGVFIPDGVEFPEKRAVLWYALDHLR